MGREDYSDRRPWGPPHRTVEGQRYRSADVDGEVRGLRNPEQRRRMPTSLSSVVASAFAGSALLINRVHPTAWAPAVRPQVNRVPAR
jgi:hypothetical protein